MKSCGTDSLPVYMYRELKSFEVSLLYVQSPPFPPFNVFPSCLNLTFAFLFTL